MRTHPALVALFLLPSFCFGADYWSPINPEELNLKTPTVQKDAAAEVLFWEIKLENEFNGGYGKTVLSHYLRIKIFTDKGRDAATAEIPYARGMSVSNIGGRTIKADGAIREPKSDAIFDKEMIKVSGLKVRAKTFVLPDVAAGDIVEYRYRENWEEILNYIRVPMQRTIPVQKGAFRVRPLSRQYMPFDMRVKVFHGANTPFTVDPEGYSLTTFENVPAYKEEPDMPPENEIRAWMLIFYSAKSDLAPAKFWTDFGHKMYAVSKPAMKANDEIKRESAKIIGDASAPSEKLLRLYNFCQSKIRNSNTLEVSADERKEMKANRTPADTLKQGIGTGADIDNLFAALATAAGFDARPAVTSDRSDAFLDPNFADPYFLNARSIAIRLNDKWTFYDPANRYVPCGMLRWQEEGVNALIGDPDKPEWVATPTTAARYSKTVRTGKFQLSEDGTLEGTVKIAYMGHEMVVRRTAHQKESLEKRKKDIEDSLARRLPGAEVSGIEIEHPEGVEPLIYSYHVKVPGYAQRTGKRLFIAPAFFQRNTSPRFPNSERLYPIYFNFAWSEPDNIEIDLPEGYSLDRPDAPAGVDGQMYQYHVKMQIRDHKTLVYQREMALDGIFAQLKIYPQVKTLFDAQYKADEHLISLKSDAAPGALTGGLQSQ